ncbi:NADPH-dependent FMN reductase [Frondihabitans australicus]|uniref:NAD(P)H-dependent FMN reductase n=1 Tax=Frondihabitans australicus TaxID=386892 RepID=A0A495IJG0_9MICO|nr:NAD(P)H-dependent oxidoreductase [Frondihabitans australicus]RKR75850.1 NAD(P)H-dependent FMN reductase [Frondihabitans australicus]
MMKIAVILASTRPGRTGEAVARWVMDNAVTPGDADYELVDLDDHTLPDLDEPVPPAAGLYAAPHTLAWAEVVGRFDGYVFVTPEYNHSFPGKLKNALDRVWAEWNNKAAGFVSYGADGRVRAVEALRPVCATLRIADVGPAVALTARDDWDGFGGPFTPRDFQQQNLAGVLDAAVSWSTALSTIRNTSDRS